jgi:Holliday junction resolvase
MLKKRLPEEALAEKVIAWLEADNWDVYQEVRPWPTYARAIDIVAVKPGMIWAIECKTSLLTAHQKPSQSSTYIMA